MKLDPKEYVGKTIEKFLVRQDEILFLFTDKSTLKAEAWGSEDSAYFEFVLPTNWDKVNLGLMTKEEFDKLVIEEDRFQDAEREKRDRAQFEVLKKRFEPKGE